ncbi:DNA internalization-related competence protein ComEC/Rec2 [Gracilimonas sp. Q87]|uniref:DNA internalization-related competence protein ComEC/Rec2 n=1 Tax=Gracilimonas sp. Q87 TaxID=3384766 RepID=UPI0039841673
MERRDTYRFPYSRYPAVRIALFYIAGILLFYFYEPASGAVIGIFAGLFLLYALSEWMSQRSVLTRWSKFASVLFLILIVLYGQLRMAVEQYSERSVAVELLEKLDWEKVETSGQLVSISYTSTGKMRWDVETDTTYYNGVVIPHPYKARILADEVEGDVTLGDKVFISAIVIPISEKRNPLDFNYKAYLRSQDISVQLKADSLFHVTPNNKIGEWIWWREKALELVDKNFSEQTAPIAKALLIGFKQDLDTHSKSAFARAGLSHIMAVSGLHVGFIIAPFWVIIPYFWTWKHGKVMGLLLLVLILISYAGITGFSPSVSRASVMAFFLTYGKLYHKINDSINLTAAAAITLLIYEPTQLFEIGFQLSFSAVLIILLILPVIQNLLPNWVRIHWYGKPLMVVIVSLVVQFGLYPLQVYYFGEISLVSPLANALFVPLLGIVVPLSLLALGITAVIPALGFWINIPSFYFLEGMREFVMMAASWNWAWTTASLNNSFFFIFWLILIFTIAAWHIASMRWKMLNTVLAAACILVAWNLSQEFRTAKFTVIYFDVGQGDAALLQTPTGKNILIDAGVWSPGYNSGKGVILPHLQASGIKKLDAIVLSHPHSDHIGGIVDLINEIEIGMIYNSGYRYDSELYKTYLETAAQKGVPVESIQEGDTLNIDPAMLFLVMGPDGQTHNSDPNEHSVIMNVIYGESEFLFTGDAGIHQEQRVLSRYDNLLDTDVLKVGHHGSRTSSGLAFLNRVTPDYSIISLSEPNRYRHPHKEAIQRLSTTGSEMLFTSLEKAVILETDGKSIGRVHWD